MLDTVSMISVLVGLVFVALSVIYYIFRNKKPDAKDSSETKAVITESKQVQAAIKKTKKKVGKKGSLIDSDIGSAVDDATIDIEIGENPGLVDKKESVEIIEEVINPIKSVEEMALPPSKKRKNRTKQPSGDPVATEVKTAGVDKNENQSNTLLGRSSEEKLKEDIQCLQKKLDDLEKEKAKNEISLKEIKILIQGKETENESLKSDLKDASARLKEAQAHLNSQKEDIQRKLEDMKSQSTKNDEGHKKMYDSYENKIEQLKTDIKKINGEKVSLNNVMKSETNKRDEIQRRCDEVGAILTQKTEELRTNNLELNKFRELNTSLKSSVQELQETISIKEKEFQSKYDVIVKNGNELRAIIENLERSIEDKVRQMGDISKNKNNLEAEVAHMRRTVDELKEAISNSEKEKETFNKNNINIRKELEIMVSEIVELKGNNEALQNRMENLKKQELDLQRDAMVDSNVQLNNSVCALERVLNEKDVELGKLTGNKEFLENKLSSFNAAITELKLSSLKKEETLISEKKQMENNVDKLKEIVGKLESDNKEKICELSEVRRKEELLVQELSSLREADGSLMKKITTYEDSNRKLSEQKTHLEVIVHDLNREMEELKINNDYLTQQLSSNKVEFQDLQKGATPEDVLSGVIVSNVEGLNDQIRDLTRQLTDLKEELAKKEEQVANMIENTATLVSDHKSLEKQLMGEAEKLKNSIKELDCENRKLEEEMATKVVDEVDVIKETTSVHVYQECPPVSSSTDSEEVEKLKSHISKVEMELKRMQGQYHVLKDDSLKVEDTEKRAVQLVNSEVNFVNIPSDSELITDNRSSDLHDAINRLNSEIQEQRLTNQTLQESCSLTQSEKSKMRCQHETLTKDHELLCDKYRSLEKKWSVLQETVSAKSNQIDNQSDDDIDLLRHENNLLKVQLEQYRDSLETTEHMLEKIQNSVDKEETKWTTALQCSEQECGQLELRVKLLSTEIDHLKNKHEGDQFDMVASLSSLNNGTVSSDNKKKRKRKNKKKRSKNCASESNGN